MQERHLIRHVIPIAYDGSWINLNGLSIPLVLALSVMLTLSGKLFPEHECQGIAWGEQSQLNLSVDEKIDLLTPANASSSIRRALQGMREAIPQAESDPTRPVYHFRPLAQWMSDPCAVMYRDGYYHLFHQFAPNADHVTPETRMCWGHARSKDLVHWEYLPLALWASRDVGERRCNSGSMTINEDGQPMIFYTSCPIDHKSPRQQWGATGSQDLLTWEKLSVNPLLTFETHGGPRFGNGWSDPFVFRVNNRNFMILGAELGSIVGLPIYEAQDSQMTRWKYRGLFLESTKKKLSEYECPNFFKLGDKWVLLYSPGSQVQYSIGQFDIENLRFKPEIEGILDHSYGPKFPNFLTRGLYATNVLKDETGRPVIFGWASGFKQGRGWNGCLSLPRTMTIGADGRPRQSPVRELQRLRTEHMSIDAVELNGKSHLVKEVRGDTLEILAELEPGSSQSLGIHLRRSDDGTRAVTIRYDGNTLNVDGTSFPFQLAENEERLKLHVFLDKSLMEVFINDGRECVTRVVYPEEHDLGIELFASAGSARLHSLDIWQLRGIW
ncbi:MAG: glycoside hydrolase family 32 protein [Pirellulaceae bacterium]|nr:glycoside hydrolase family 32 protein [Pirellulaceae bacterium]